MGACVDGSNRTHALQIVIAAKRLVVFVAFSACLPDLIPKPNQNQ